MKKFVATSGTGMWMIPLMGILCIIVAWFIAFTLGQSVGERERDAFEQTRQTQIAACERGNALRVEVNTQVVVLREFLLRAAEARELAGTEADIEAAEDYRELAGDVEMLEIVDCEEITPDYLEESENN